MFSARFYRAWYFWTNWIACPFGAVPFQFDRTSRRMFTTFRAQKRCLRMAVFLAIGNVLLIVTMFDRKKAKDVNGFNQAYSGWILSSIWCICVGSFALQPNQVCYLFNASSNFFDRFQRLYMPNYDPDKCRLNKVIDFACFMIRWGCLLLAVLEILHFSMFARMSPFYLDYYIPEIWYTTKMRILTLWFHTSLFMVTTVSLGYCGTFMASFGLHTVYIISRDLRCGLKEEYRTSDLLRTGHHMRLNHRCLELLHCLQLDMCSFLLYPSNWLFNKMILFCGANLIKYGHQMVPIVRYTLGGWALTGLIMWGYCLELSGYMFLYSQKCITSWKYHDWGEDRRVMSKFKRSCRPMKVAFHKVFSIKRLSVLKFFRSIAKGMFKALVAL